VNRECVCGHSWAEHYQRYDGQHGCSEYDNDYTYEPSICACTGFSAHGDYSRPEPYLKARNSVVIHIRDGRGVLCQPDGPTLWWEGPMTYLWSTGDERVCGTCKRIQARKI
jgi:hypothetical protein